VAASDAFEHLGRLHHPVVGKQCAEPATRSVCRRLVPTAATLIGVPVLCLPELLVEIEGIAKV
jgi:hypothetical protein